MGGRRSDIDAHALKREHLQSFYFGYDLTFFDYEVVRMIVIVDVVVHSFASNDGFLFVLYKQESPRGLGIPSFYLSESLRLTAYCFPMALDHS